jgi:hypothetical protein
LFDFSDTKILLFPPPLRQFPCKNYFELFVISFQFRLSKLNLKKVDPKLEDDCRKRPNDVAYAEKTKGCFSELQKSLNSNRDAVGIATLTIIVFLVSKTQSFFLVAFFRKRNVF